MADDTGLRPIQFQVETPGDPEELKARRLVHERLPDATPVRSCIIIGSGPSAADEALWDRLRGLPKHGLYNTPPTIALNGALKVCLANGVTPTYWACCDPQELTTKFLPKTPPKETTYLLASKCCEALFERLRGLKVEVWRMDDVRVGERLHVPCAVSISLVAQSLMRMRGFHRFEMYGWDCCYGPAGEHHASRQPAPTADKMTFEIQNQDGSVHASFLTNGSWLAELHDATIQTFNLKTMGYEVIVHGPGAVATLLRARGLIGCGG
jgi:hypothetical protein